VEVPHSHISKCLPMPEVTYSGGLSVLVLNNFYIMLIALLVLSHLMQKITAMTWKKQYEIHELQCKIIFMLPNTCMDIHALILSLLCCEVGKGMNT